MSPLVPNDLLQHMLFPYLTSDVLFGTCCCVCRSWNDMIWQMTPSSICTITHPEPSLDNNSHIYFSQFCMIGRFNHMTRLKLNHFDCHNIIVLLSSRKLVSQLTYLDVSNCFMGFEGARYIASRQFKNLKELRMDNCEIGDKSMKCLAQSVTMNKLTRLSVKENGQISEKGAKAILTGNLKLKVLKWDGSATIETLIYGRRR